ncbi:hypothetical protein [Natronococcus wangiae]|uniref:hypothetical protein n=1 Tax=Natronococcus wangiae TaxID=3068275 RepID=UPI00273DDCCB|nr:hypothetical protein [Natronococcus sp. AD5]
MSSFETPHETERGFGLSGREVRVIGGASGLMAITVALMYVFAMTPIAEINRIAFSAPIVGVLVYGAAITIGDLIAERGVENGNTGTAFVGMVILQFAFAAFGAGVISIAPQDLRVTILAVTAIVTAIVMAVISGYVYARSTTFEHWGRFSTYGFIGGIIAIAIGTFVLQELLLAGFVLIFLGFVLRLGYEIWKVRDNRNASVGLQTIGVYVAVAGVFVHVLQLVRHYILSQQ